MEDIHALREHHLFPEPERPGRTIIDLREMELPGLTMDTVAADIGFRPDDEKPPFMALLAGPPVIFGVARQLIQYQGVGHRVRVFRDRDEALAWLYGPHPAPDEMES